MSRTTSEWGPSLALAMDIPSEGYTAANTCRSIDILMTGSQRRKYSGGYACQSARLADRRPKESQEELSASTYVRQVAAMYILHTLMFGRRLSISRHRRPVKPVYIRAFVRLLIK